MIMLTCYLIKTLTSSSLSSTTEGGFKHTRAVCAALNNAALSPRSTCLRLAREGQRGAQDFTRKTYMQCRVTARYMLPLST